MYKALKMLGYHPYHFKEAFENGIPHVEIATEALNAKYFGQGKPFGREEFDKWFQDFDVCRLTTTQHREDNVF